MALAWSPSVGPARTEDTVVIDSRGYEVVTDAQNWPQLEVAVKGFSSPARESSNAEGCATGSIGSTHSPVRTRAPGQLHNKARSPSLSSKEAVEFGRCACFELHRTFASVRE